MGIIQSNIMKLAKLFVITLLVSASLSARAQYHKLLNLTERQIKDKITEFPIVNRDSSEHEFIPYLTFKNKDNETQLVVYFFGNKCYQVKHFTPSTSFNSIMDSADKMFNRIGKGRWRSKENTFEVSIIDIPEKVVTIYSRGISTY